MTELRVEAERFRDDVVQFLHDLIALPSPTCGEERVAERVMREMRSLGYEDVARDDMGNVIGRIGDGQTRVVLDAHMDTVGTGDPGAWSHDPYVGRVEDGVIFGRGASDNKGAIASEVYGGKLAMERALAETDVTLYVVGTVMEEDCDGLALGHVLTETIPDAHAVVLGECTNLDVYRGHRGRMEMTVTTKGRSAHASAPERGVNALAAMAPIVDEVTALNERLAYDDFLGRGSVAVTSIDCDTASLNAIPDRCRIYVDRRLTMGETLDSALAELRALPSIGGAEIDVPEYAEPSYTGLSLKTEKYFPTWTLEEDHPLVRAGVRAGELALGAAPAVGKWTFSTNGVASAGRLGIPTIGFGPSEERWAHTVDDQCPIDHLVAAIAFYAALPRALSEGAQTP
jgi:putative selenium metabolism hydrolase